MCEDYVGAGLGVSFAVGRLRYEQSPLDAIVDDEEGGGGGGRAKEDGWEAGIDTAEGLAEGDTGLGCGVVACFLESGFDGVERVERAVDG